MSLIGKNIWVVGGVGIVGRGIARGLLQAGATVVVNSRKVDRLDWIQAELQYPPNLIAIHGSLKPDFCADTVRQALKNRPLDHVVAHGAVRYWTLRGGCSDETHSLRPKDPFLQQSAAEFTAASSALASFHFSAIQELLPRIVEGSYTFVTGDGCGHPSSQQTPLGELNAHHVRGLAAAMRRQLQKDPNVQARELRVGFPVPQTLEELRQNTNTISQPISEEIGDLCAGLIVATQEHQENRHHTTKSSGSRIHQAPEDLIKVESEEQLHALLETYQVTKDEALGELPSICDYATTTGTPSLAL
jgi:NAD(P)-dependent dehydrogenase (short-subunit alcohol dehydrogenase family)